MRDLLKAEKESTYQVIVNGWREKDGSDEKRRDIRMNQMDRVHPTDSFGARVWTYLGQLKTEGRIAIDGKSKTIRVQGEGLK